jgi:hypothetical protein
MWMPESMTMTELEAELEQLKMGIGGVGRKDLFRKHAIEDEIAWRREQGYADMKPKEIEDELFDKGEIQERYL